MRRLIILAAFVMIMSMHAQAAVKISKTKVTLVKGQTVTLKITGTKEKVTWTSSKKNVATVSAKGVVKGKAKGVSAIVAKVGKKAYKCVVTVETPKLNKTSATVNVGKTVTLKLNGTKQKVKWITGNSRIAAISNGKVTGKNPGKTTIAAVVGGKKYKCSIKVEKPVLSRTTADLTVGNTLQLKVNGTTQEVAWVSANNGIATVTGGLVNAVSAGTVKIAAKTGGTTLLCTVKITNPITGVYLDKSTLVIDKGTQSVLQVSWLPLNTTDDTTVSWTSSDERIVKVENGIIAGIRPGNATVTAAVGEKEAACYVQVNETYGSVSGNVTYLYNNYRGHVADEGALVYLIPSDGSAKDYVQSSYTSLRFGPPSDINQYGIYAAKVDGTGAFLIQNVPSGEYIVFIISDETSDEDWFDDKEGYYASARRLIAPYLNNTTAQALSEAVGYNKYYADRITVFSDKETSYSHDFGITYI